MTTTTPGGTVWQALASTSITVRFLLLGAFVNQLGYFIQAYIVVFMLDRGFEQVQAGWGLAVFSAGSILGTLVAAPLSARIGDRDTIIVASILMAISVSLIPLAVTPERPGPVWIGIIATAGVFAQMYRPAAAHILSHEFSPDTQVMGFSMFRIALNFGAALGPVIATALARDGWKFVFWFDAASTLALAAIALTMIPGGRATAARPAGGSSAWGTLMTDMRFLAFLSAMFLSAIVYTQFYAALPLGIQSEGKPLATYSKLLTVYAVLLICCELKISSIVCRFPIWVPATIGTTVLCLGIASFGLTLTSDAGLILSAVIMSSGLMVSGPTMFAYPARFPQAVRGTYIAANQAVFSAGMALGPIVGIALLNAYGRWVWAFCFALALISGAFCTAGMRPRPNTLRDPVTAGASK